MRSDTAAAPPAEERRAAPDWIVCACEDRRFALPLRGVRQILPPQPYTRLPGSVAAVVGLIGVRGRVAPVVDLGPLTGAAPATAAADHRIVLVQWGDGLAGMRVGRIVCFAETPPQDAVVVDPTWLLATVLGEP